MSDNRIVIKAIENNVESAENPKRKAWIPAPIKKLVRIPLAAFGLVILFIIIVCAIFSPWIAPHDPIIQYSGHYLEQPSGTFLLGTDQMGRDTLSRVIFGSRIALIVSFGSVIFGIAIGVPLGLTAAYTRGWLDEVIMRVMDAIISFPGLILAIALIAVLGNSLVNVIIAIGIPNVPWIARIVRSQALSVRERDFVTAARAVGASPLRIIGRHLWPNCTAPIIVQGTLELAYAILIEAALGFIGLGVMPPTPTWGNMLRYNYQFLERSPILSIVPGLAIFLMVLAVNFVGDSLRDVLDPRLRGLIR